MGGGGRGGGGGMGGGRGGAGGSVGGGSLAQFLPEDVTDIVAVPILNGVIIRGSEQGVNELIEFIKMIDRKPQQIIVELQSVLVSTEMDKSFGIQWFYAMGNTTIEPIGFTPPGASVRIGYAGHADFQATLSYLLRTGQGRVTDAIRISTMNLLPAYNAVVVSYPLIQVGGVAGGGLGGGGVQTVTITYVPITTYLSILPQILGDGTINMVIPYQKSTRTGSVPVPLATYGSYDAPIWTVNSILTTINVRDGETFVVGGFVGGIDESSELRFPILGDLPLIGDLLFTRRTRTVTESETLLFITPHIVKEEAAPVTLGPI
jgi:general secretion pathway protein D